MIAGGDPYHSVDLLYQHIGGDDAVGLNLTFSNLHSIIESVTIKRRVSGVGEGENRGTERVGKERREGEGGREGKGRR